MFVGLTSNTNIFPEREQGLTVSEIGHAVRRRESRLPEMSRVGDEIGLGHARDVYAPIRVQRRAPE